MHRELPDGSIVSTSSVYDDGTQRGFNHVEVDGLPGTWPQSPTGHGGPAYRAEQHMRGWEGTYGSRGAIPEDVISSTVGQANDYPYRSKYAEPEVAEQAAYYEDAIRTALPAASIALKEARESAASDASPDARNAEVAADLKYQEMIRTANQRSRQAVTDHRAGIDRTEEIRQEDTERFA